MRKKEREREVKDGKESVEREIEAEVVWKLFLKLRERERANTRRARARTCARKRAGITRESTHTES